MPTTIIIDADKVICSDEDDVTVVVVKPDWNGQLGDHADDAGVIYDELTETIATLLALELGDNETFDTEVADLIVRLVEERRIYTPRTYTPKAG